MSAPLPITAPDLRAQALDVMTDISAWCRSKVIAWIVLEEDGGGLDELGGNLEFAVDLLRLEGTETLTDSNCLAASLEGAAMLTAADKLEAISKLALREHRLQPIRDHERATLSAPASPFLIAAE